MWRLTAERELMSMLSTSLADQVTETSPVGIRKPEQTGVDSSSQSRSERLLLISINESRKKISEGSTVPHIYSSLSLW